MSQQTTQAPPADNKQQVKRFEENAVNQVLAKVNDFTSNGNLQLPPKYSAENALRSAWLMIQQTQDLNKKPALDVCTKESIANALFDMVLQGLSPAKKQCYFIVYGNKLQMQRSYFGTIAMSKRVAGVADAVGVPVYKNDTFKYEIDLKTGQKKVTEHLQDFDNIDPQNLKGAYAIITYEDGTIEYEIMTMSQIFQSWQMGTMKGNSPAHKSFPDQMACRTVINRALKIPVNSSNDDDLYGEPVQSTYAKQVEADMNHQISTNSNGAAGNDSIGFDDDAVDTDYTEEGAEQQQQEAEQVTEPSPVVNAQPQQLFNEPQAQTRKRHF